MGTGSALPTHEALVRDLKIVRSKGLTKLRGVSLPTLEACAGLLGEAQGDSSPAAIERVLRRGIEALGGGPYGEAAEALFGLAEGKRGLGPRERQEAAGDALGKSASTLRTRHQANIVSVIADRLLDLLHEAAQASSSPTDEVTSVQQDETAKSSDTRLSDHPSVAHRAGRRTSLTVVAIEVVNVATAFDQAQERMVGLLLELLNNAATESETSYSVIPTGDGAIALAETPSVASAIEIVLAVKDAIDERLLRLPVRVGVHTGDAAVTTLSDGSSAYVGTLLTLAQRLMDLEKKATCCFRRKQPNALPRTNDSLTRLHVLLQTRSR